MINLKEWFADDGLMTLGPGQFKKSFKGLPGNTVWNENGILYLVLFMWLTNKDYDFLATQERLWHPTEPLFYRNPGGWPRCNSWDNYVAHACGCIFVGDHWTFEKVMTNWPILNDFDPGKINLKWNVPSGASFNWWKSWEPNFSWCTIDVLT